MDVCQSSFEKEQPSTLQNGDALILENGIEEAAHVNGCLSSSETECSAFQDSSGGVMDEIAGGSNLKTSSTPSQKEEHLTSKDGIENKVEEASKLDSSETERSAFQDSNNGDVMNEHLSSKDDVENEVGEASKLDTSQEKENLTPKDNGASLAKDEMSSTSDQDYSSLIGAVVTQQMVQEQKKLEAKILSEEKKLQAEIMKKQKAELEEVCYKRLNLLLTRSSTYAQFFSEKLQRDKLKEKKNELRAEKRKAKSKTENPNKKRQRSATESPRKKKMEVLSEEEEEDDVGIVREIAKYDGQPSLLTGGVMYPYQIEGYEWLKVVFENGVNGILADEMGLGKTIQTIAFIAYLIEMGVSGPFFICGPLSTVPNWYAEFRRFTPSIPVEIYHGDINTRAQLRKKITQKTKNKDIVSCPVFITSYQIALNDAKLLSKFHWKLLVIDEAHRIKNFRCKLVCALKLYKTMHRLLLTGTPLQNDLSELWSLLNFILPEIFDCLDVFESWFDISRLAEEGGTNEIIAKEQEKQIVSKIHEILAPFLLRRTKAEVQLKLPQKKEVIVHAPLTKLQQEYYTAVLNKTIEATVGLKTAEQEIVPEKRQKCVESFTDIYQVLEDEGFDNVPKTFKDFTVSKETQNVLADVKVNVRNTTMILRKVCNHPYLISYPIDPNTADYKVDEDLIRNSGKLLVLDAMLPELKKRGHKILMFSQFVTMLEVLQDYCYYRDYKYCLLKGTMSLEERQEMIESFNTDDDIFIFLISTKAGGLGLNLTAADTVIIYDSDWNPQGDIQAQDRCHRIGQDKPVIVYRVIVPNTVDERIITRAEAKRKLEKVIIKKGRFNSNHDKSSKKLSIEELIELLQSSDLSGFVKTDDNCVLSPEELEKLLDRSDMIEAK